jgi:HEAT repeat protein
MSALSSDHEQARYFAAFAAGEHSSTGDDLVSRLCALTGDPSPRVRATAVEALGQKAVGGESAVALAAATRDPVPDVRQNAALALARLGPAAAGAVPDLRRLLGDPHGYTSALAADALREVEPA